MPRARIEAGRFALRAVEPRDIEAIRTWRNAQMQWLRQPAPIDAESQAQYFAANIWPAMALAEPANILVSFEEAGVLIGYGGLVHIAWEHRRAEVSFLLDPAHVDDHGGYAERFLAFLGLLQTLAFDDLHLGRLWTETFDGRDRHIAILEKAGFVREGRLREHMRIDGRPVDSIIHGRLAGARESRA